MYKIVESTSFGVLLLLTLLLANANIYAENFTNINTEGFRYVQYRL